MRSMRPSSWTTSKFHFFDASKWWSAGKLLSTGPARPACREPVEALK